MTPDLPADLVERCLVAANDAADSDDSDHAGVVRAVLRERDQWAREKFAADLGVVDVKSIGVNTPLEELYHRAGKFTRSELEACVAEMVAALEEADSAVNWAIQQGMADQQGHDRTSDRLDKMIHDWRQKRAAVLSRYRSKTGEA